MCCRADLDAPKQRHFGAGAGALAALLATPRAWAEGLELPADLTYPGLNVPELPNVPDAAGLSQLVSDYPLLLPAAAGLVVVPLLISQINRGGSKVQGISATRALEVLSTEDAVAFVDIRSKESAKQYGDPNLSSVKKPTIRVPFTKVGFSSMTSEPRSLSGRLCC